MIPCRFSKYPATVAVTAVFCLLAAPLPGGFHGATTAAGAPAAAEGADSLFDASITVPELFEKAREAFGLQRLDLAEKFYQEILIRERSNVQAMLELANVYERSGRLEYARGLLARAVKVQQDSPAILARLRSVEHMLSVVLGVEVDSLLAQKQYELAVPKLSVHLSIDPRNPELLYKRALCYVNLGKPDAALSNINQALRISQQEKYYQLRSTILEYLRDEETEGLIEQAKQLLRSDTPEDREKGLEVLAEILRLEPENAWARTELVRVGHRSGPSPDETVVDRRTDAVALLDNAKAVLSAAGRLVDRHLAAVLALLAVLIIFRSPLTRRLAGIVSPQALLSGSLLRFDLHEVLLMLNAESHSGVLRVRGDGCRGKIYLKGGEPCHCVAGKLTGMEALVYLFAQTSKGHFEFKEGSLPPNRTIDIPLSIIMVEQSKVRLGAPADTKASPAPAASKPKKPKSRMKELLESKTQR